MKLKDLTGQRFGRLVVLKRAPNKKKHTYWTCQCDCGTIKDIGSQSLLNGDTISCGCYHQQVLKEINNSLFKDLTGKKFGTMTVLRLATKEEKGNRKTSDNCWICQCDCGNIKIFSSSNLQNQINPNCGCQFKQSYGEEKIKNILIANNILYEKEKTFQTCKFPKSNCYARFDFFINNSYLIEYDGEQHFLKNTSIRFSEKEIKEIQERDKFKNQWCKENNIPLIRIPYTQFKNLSINDLLLETSKFVVKE